MNPLNMHITEVKKHMKRRNYDKDIEEINNEIEKINLEENDFSDYDSAYAQTLDYKTNYLKKDLIKIAEYYDIDIRKKTKNILIEDILSFENNPENCIIVERRQTMWFYLNELMDDNYLRKYIIFD
tara:strand:- start:2605 stop:2982 length:378 start_codon:yes stop_codon:yes gene_type:complete